MMKMSKKIFEPNEFEWDEKNQEILLNHAEKILGETRKKIHTNRPSDDELQKMGFWELFRLPFAYSAKYRAESGRNFLALLMTGIGIVLFWRGIWDGSAYIFSTTGSLVIGAAILIIMAIIGRRQVFKIFGGGE